MNVQNTVRIIRNIGRFLRKGEEVGNVEAWKLGQIGANAVVGLLIALYALLDGFAWMPEVTGGQLETIGLGLFTVINILFTAVTSKRAGLPAKRPGT